MLFGSRARGDAQERSDYDEPPANQIYENIKIYHPEIFRLAQLIRQKYPH
jgi:hypothetical protein